MKAPTLDELTQRLERMNPEAKALWGRMNLAQMLLHCRVAMEAGMGDRIVKKPEDSFAKRWLLYPLLMLLPWPKGKAPTYPEFDILETRMPVLSVTEEAAALTGRLKSFIGGNFPLQRHAIFGRLSRVQWSNLQRKHLDHHFRQFGI
ncbi:MAG: hypothetical protein JWP91_3443 [Fibrobacteres bacterium]|nr:hypothetical protein [Fibrobacterota bacterium]